MSAEERPPEGAAVSASRAEKLWPVKDPNVPHPGRRFYGGAWQTPEAIEKKRTGTVAYQSAHRAEYVAYAAARHLAICMKPGTCGTKGCDRPKIQLSTGAYAVRCREHQALANHKWYVTKGYIQTLDRTIAKYTPGTPQYNEMLSNFEEKLRSQSE